MGIKHDSSKWWLPAVESGRERHEVFWETWGRVRQKNQGRRAMLAQACTLYDDAGLADLAPNLFEIGDAPQTLNLNVIRQVVNTLANKFVKNRPLPKPITFRAGYAARRRARDLGDFFAGDLHNCEAFETLALVIRDALWSGTGMSIDFEEGTEILHRRLLPWEIDVDPREARHGRPRSAYITQYFDRDVLRDMFVHDDDDDAAAIDEAITTAQNYLKDTVWDPDKDDLSDVIPVGIGIHLPSGPKADDGRIVLGISSRLLMDKLYKRQRLPVNKLCYVDPIAGYFGQGVPHDIEGIQYGLLDFALKWQEANYGTPTGIVAIQENDTFNLERLGNNGAWQEARYSGASPPQFQTLEAAGAGLAAGIEMIKKWCFDFSGLSQLSAQSQNPFGNEANAKAMREYSDFETERFLQFGRNIEEYMKSVAWNRYEIREESKSGRKVRVETRSFNRRFLRDLKWEDVRADRETFKLRVFSTSLLSQTPSARRADVDAYVQMGFLSPDEAKAAIFGEEVDTDELGALESAATEIVDSICEHLLTCDAGDKAQYIYPEPQFNLDLCLSRGTKHFLIAQLDHFRDPESIPSENVDLLADWLEDVRRLKEKAEAEAAAKAAPSMPGGMPPGGMPPPGMPPAGMPPMPSGGMPPPPPGTMQ